MPIFYTKKGDRGWSYIGKKSFSKTCLEIEALGQSDELNSMIGVLKSQKISKWLQNILHQIQENLFIIQSNVASAMLSANTNSRSSTANFDLPELKSSEIEEIEKIIDKIEKRLPPIKKFVIPGINHTSAWLDLLRAKSRNVERSVLGVFQSNSSNNSNVSNILSYLNRLSSLLFALARWEARNKKEKNPRYKQVAKIPLFV